MIRLHPTDAAFQTHFARRFQTAPPDFIDTLGNLELLTGKLTAFFCSAKCPGETLLQTYDLATRWRDERRTVISGFHSPVERDCLRILLRGTQPVIICPARSLAGMRLPAEWKPALDGGRLLVLSPFPETAHRASARLAAERNAFTAALADEIVIAHATPGGTLSRLAASLAAAGKAVSSACPLLLANPSAVRTSAT